MPNGYYDFCLIASKRTSVLERTNDIGKNRGMGLTTVRKNLPTQL